MWVDAIGKKKGKVFGLGSMGKILVTSSNQSLMSSIEDVDGLRNQIHTLNESLQRQEEEKLQMKQELNDARKEVQATKKEVQDTRN